MTKLVKVFNKHKGSSQLFFDHNLELIYLWSADVTRNWVVYDPNPKSPSHLLEGGSSVVSSTGVAEAI